MANEIYPVSWWGSPVQNGWGGIYYDYASNALADFGLGDRIEDEGGFIENTDALEAYDQEGRSPQPTILMIPSAYRDGKLLSALPSDGNGDFTFGRGSLATRTDSLGVIKNVEVVGSELTTNGDFSNGSTGWTLQDQWSIVNETAVLVGDGSPNTIQYPIAFELGKTYRVEFDVLALNGGAGKFQVQAGTAQTFVGVGSHSYDFTITNPPLSAIQFARHNGAINMTLDNISVKEITSATDMPRINYVGTPHLLIEPTRTNLFVNPGGFTDSGNWKRNASMVATGNATISPDGTLNATRLVKSGGGSRFGQEVALTKDSTYTLSFYIKNNGGNASIIADFDGQSAAQPYTITNDWARYEFTFTATSTETSQIRLVSGVSDIDLFAFGAQLEVGSSATSYIPTDASIKTRLQDVATLDLTGFSITSIVETIDEVEQSPITVIPSTYSIPIGKITKIEMY